LTTASTKEAGVAETGEIFIITVPATAAELVTPTLPPGFASIPAANPGPEFRFGIGEFSEYVGVAKDLAEFTVALLGILAALRKAGHNSIGVRRANDAEPVEIGVDMNEAAIRAKLKQRPDP
jgi:hypothetical protein